MILSPFYQKHKHIAETTAPPFTTNYLLLGSPLIITFSCDHLIPKVSRKPV